MSLVANHQRRVVKTRLRYRSECVVERNHRRRVVKTRLRYQSERVAGSSHKRRVMTTRLRAPAEPSPRHLRRQQPTRSTRGAFTTAFAKTKNLSRRTRGAFATTFANSPKTLGGRAYTKGRSPSGRSLNRKISFSLRWRAHRHEKWHTKHLYQTFCS